MHIGFHSITKSRLLKILGILAILVTLTALLLVSFNFVVSSRPLSFSNDITEINNSNGQYKVLPVPYLSQGDTNWCFDASLAMVLQYYGETVEPVDVAQSLNQGPKHSVSLFDIMFGRISSYVSIWPELSVNCSYGVRDFDKYRAMLDDGIPVVTSSFSLPFSGEGHTIVVVGYSLQDDHQYLFINDPSGYLSCSKWEADRTSYVKVDWQQFESYSESAWSHVIVHQASQA